MSGTLALSAGQAGPRLRARSGLDGEGGNAEEEERPREKIRRSRLLVLGFPSLEQEEWDWKGLGHEEVPSRRRGHAGPETPLESRQETEDRRLWFSRRQG